MNAKRKRQICGHKKHDDYVGLFSAGECHLLEMPDITIHIKTPFDLNGYDVIEYSDTMYAVLVPKDNVHDLIIRGHEPSVVSK